MQKVAAFEEDVAAIHDVERIEALLRAYAADGEAVSYSALLNALGLRFSRPKMRSLCRTLDEIDQRARAAGQPALAVLVVRESDGLPGQGWWTGRTRYSGLWEGPEAKAYVAKIQRRAFRYWRTVNDDRCREV